MLRWKQPSEGETMQGELVSAFRRLLASQTMEWKHESPHPVKTYLQTKSSPTSEIILNVHLGEQWLHEESVHTEFFWSWRTALQPSPLICLLCGLLPPASPHCFYTGSSGSLRRIGWVRQAMRAVSGERRQQKRTPGRPGHWGCHL